VCSTFKQGRDSVQCMQTFCFKTWRRSERQRPSFGFALFGRELFCTV